jgi:hypothetical protein
MPDASTPTGTVSFDQTRGSFGTDEYAVGVWRVRQLPR